MIAFLVYLLFLYCGFATPLSASAKTDQGIEMTNNGFSPQRITINVNDTVVFINTDTAVHWPASDIHPSHGIYPAFVAKKAIAPASSWSFPFDRVGTWRFHDHLAPEFTGVIRVEGNQNITPLPQESNSLISKFNTLTHFVRI